MEKEFNYVAPMAEVLRAQVEKGVYASGEEPGDSGDWQNPEFE